MSGKVIFAGAGPGAVDLITLRGKEAIENADVIIYAGSLVNPELLNFAKETAEKYSSAGIDLDEVISIIKKSVEDGKKVLRLHTGDPSIYGAIAEQMDELDSLGIDYEVIPGVSSALAAAAELKLEMTLPGITQSAIFTRRAGRTPVPEKEKLETLAANNATMAIFLSISDIDGLIEELISAGRSPNSPIAVVYRASWPNQKIVRGTLKNISEKVREAGISRQAMIITGEALARQGEKSLLYAENFAHGYRGTKKQKLFKGTVAVYAVTEKGCHKAAEIAEGLPEASLFLPERYSKNFSAASGYEQGTLKKLTEENWHNFDGHIFVMACGIVVRHIAPLIKSKLSDPAVAVCDENGSNCISLLSGHLGGANRLSEMVVGITGGKAVITTATDSNNLTSFDELAAVNVWEITNPRNIKILNTMLLEDKKIDMLIPENIFEEYYKDRKNLRLIESPEKINSDGAVLLNAKPGNREIPCLLLETGKVSLGIGCRKNTTCGEIEEAVTKTLKKIRLDISSVTGLASLDAKKNEKGLLEFAEKHKIEPAFYSAEELNRIKCPNKSPRAEKEFGTSSVAEAAALLHSRAECLLLEKQKYPMVTVAVAIPEKGIKND